MNIHPTAILDPKAKIHPSCKIGPYCTVEAQVELGENCELISQVALQGPSKIGAHNVFYPFCAVGLAPQDLTYKGEPTRLEMGDHNVVREFVTINRGTVKGGGLTRVGSHTLIMAYTHIAHDCFIGDHVIMANSATLGGHVIVEDWATVGALVPDSSFRAHRQVFVCRWRHDGYERRSSVLQDGRGPRHSRLWHNAVGLERHGFSAERIRKIHHAYKVLLASKLNTSQALEKLKAEADRGEDVDMLIEFIERSERGVIK